MWKRRFLYRKYRDLIQGFLFTVTVLVQYLIAVFENLDLQLQLQYSGNPCTVTVRYNLALWFTLLFAYTLLNFCSSCFENGKNLLAQALLDFANFRFHSHFR